MIALRKDLQIFVPTSNSYKDNLGLRLEKLNRDIDDANSEHDAKDAALGVMTSFQFSPAAKTAYSYSFDEWKSVMNRQPNTECFEIKSTTKVLLGTGNASVFEFGFNLSKPYGVPYITGSSLKGLVSAYLAKNGNEDWFKSNKNTEKSQYQVQLFGGRYDKSDYIGSVNFYDARISPKASNWFVKDIITTHHQKYYGDGNQARLPDGTENPIPINMVALNTEIKFLVVLQGSEGERKFIKKVLLEALENDGIGGKTAVGYGRFEYVTSKAEQYEAIKSYSVEQLFQLPKGKSLGEDPKYDNSVRYALENNDISDKLKDKHKKYCPLRYIRLHINKKADISFQEFKQLEKNVRTNLRNNLKQCPELIKSKDAHYIFDFAIKQWPLSEEEIKNQWLLNKISYTWSDIVNEDNILDIIDQLAERSWPPPDTLKDWLKKSTLSNKDEMLEFLE